MVLLLSSYAKRATRDMRLHVSPQPSEAGGKIRGKRDGSEGNFPFRLAARVLHLSASWSVLLRLLIAEVIGLKECNVGPSLPLLFNHVKCRDRS